MNPVTKQAQQHDDNRNTLLHCEANTNRTVLHPPDCDHGGANERTRPTESLSRPRQLVYVMSPQCEEVGHMDNGLNQQYLDEYEDETHEADREACRDGDQFDAL